MKVPVTLNVILVPKFLAMYGEGGAGRAAATALLVTETYTVIAMLLLLGKRALDSRLMRMLAVSFVAAAAAVVVDHLLRPLGALRSVVALSVYAGIVLSSGTVDIRGAVSLLTSLRTGAAQPAQD